MTDLKSAIAIDDIDEVADAVASVTARQVRQSGLFS